MKKCPISRTNIIHFETFALYQNVSYKMAGAEGIEPSSKVLETSVLPLNQAPSGYLLYLTLPFRQEANPRFFRRK